MQIKKIIKRFLLPLALAGVASAAQRIDYIGSFSCYNPQTNRTDAKYILLETQSERGFRPIGGKQGSTLKDFYSSLEKTFIFTQEINGTCSPKDLITLKLKKPIPDLAIFKLLTEVFDFQYYLEGDSKYNPSYIVLYKEGIKLKDLLALLKKKIQERNKELQLVVDLDNNLIAIVPVGEEAPFVPRRKKSTAACTPQFYPNYADICSKGICQRFGLIIDELGNIQLKPFLKCEDGKAVPVKGKNSCKLNTPVALLYINDIDLPHLLKVFEKILGIHFLYSEEELKKLKGGQHIHLVLKCLTEKKVIDFLKRNFHLYIEPVAEHFYKVIPDRDAYPVVLQEVSDYISKVFYIRGITLEDFVKILENRYGDKVIYSADPTFNAVTVIGPPDVVKDIERTLGVYIRNSSAFDNLISKIFYVKFGDINQIVEKIKNYLSEKGTVKILNEARAIEITDYPTNISMVEKVFGKFLSQKPVKIKVSVKFVSVDKSFARSLGFNWAFVYTGTPVSVGQQNFGNYNFGGSGSESIISAVGESYLQGTNPTSLLAVQFAYHKFNPISLQLSALETISKARTLDNPTLVLLNDQQATITRGIQIPYQQSAENGGTTVQLVSANINLNVKPTLLPDGRILLKLQLSKNTPGDVINGQVSINTFNINDAIVVADGATLVIGGVVQVSNSRGESGIPYLRNIPLLGWLFKNVNWQKSNKELLVFITAKVVSE